MPSIRKEIKITTSGTSTLIAKVTADVRFNEGLGVKKIHISNNETDHHLHDVYVFLEDAAANAATHPSNNKYFLVYDLSMPPQTALVLDDCVDFDSHKYNLRIKTGNNANGDTPDLSIIIR